MDRFPPSDGAEAWGASLETLLRHGPLARRMLSAVDAEALTAPAGGRALDELRDLYRDLASCLDANEPFVP